MEYHRCIPILQHGCYVMMSFNVVPHVCFCYFWSLYQNSIFIIIADHTTFFGVIVIHIHRLLNEREHIYEQGADWVLVEALDTKKLHSNGTLQNVLARKLDDEMSRPFTEIIAFIDRHYNLDLLDEAFNDRSKAYFARLWLAIFRLETILPFKFSDLIIGQKVPGIGGRMLFSDFKCKFPFSWIVKQTFDDVWINAKTVAG